MSEEQATSNSQRRTVPVELVETTPDSAAALHWLLAAPLLIFLAWAWVDLFAQVSSLPAYWLDVVLALPVYVALVVLPLGIAAHRIVTSMPRLFQHAGWDVLPLEPVAAEEQYTVRYAYRTRHRAPGTRWRWLMRAGQGWVYIEIAAIFVGAILLIPIFFSVSEFGFGR